MCICRGIEIDKKTQNEKIKDLKLWLALSNLRNVPNSLLLCSRLSLFADDLFASTHNPAEIITRNLGREFYDEKVRIFDKAFHSDLIDQNLNQI